MILAFPEVCDALTASLQQVLGENVVFDGPPARIPGSSGLAIGATREDTSSDFSASAAGLDGAFGEDMTITCLAWSGTGGVTFKPMRDKVRDIVVSTAARLAADRTLGGVVDTVDLSGGTWQQEQTGEGALVTCEFRITVRKF